MTVRSHANEQNSAYGPTNPSTPPWRTTTPFLKRLALMEQDKDKTDPPYPASWDQVAEIRVFRATVSEWERLIAWRGDMKRKGWKLLRVNTRDTEITAIFGRTRSDLNSDALP